MAQDGAFKWFADPADPSGAAPAAYLSEGAAAASPNRTPRPVGPAAGESAPAAGPVSK